MDTTHTATSPATRAFVAIRHNALNTSVFTVEPLADGMERVTYVGRDDRTPVVDYAIAAAESLAANLDSPHTTVTENGVTVDYYDNAWAAGTPRLTPGVHRAVVSLDDEQTALRAELAEQRRTSRNRVPEIGERWVVAELTGYLLVQNRPLDHRSCHCGNGTTTYSVGTVVDRAWYADNSIEITVELVESGRRVTDQLVAPHGDACF
jgi:hypothetical protein